MIETRNKIHQNKNTILGTACSPRWTHGIRNAAVSVGIIAGFITVLWVLPEAILEG
jgi:hypothetical protein